MCVNHTAMIDFIASYSLHITPHTQTHSSYFTYSNHTYLLIPNIAPAGNGKYCVRLYNNTLQLEPDSPHTHVCIYMAADGIRMNNLIATQDLAGAL